MAIHQNKIMKEDLSTPQALSKELLLASKQSIIKDIQGHPQSVAHMQCTLFPF